MPKYLNTSIYVKSFYGVEFKPGESKYVPGYINDSRMIRVTDEDKVVSKAANVTSTKSQTKSTSKDVDTKASKIDQSKESTTSTKEDSTKTDTTSTSK